MNNDSSITPIGETIFRGENREFGIKLDDRRRHIYVLGKTGVGKSTLLENMIINDIRDGKGVAFLDPHGESAEKILDFIPEDRLDDVIYFDPSDIEYPIAFNPLEEVGPEFRHLVASSMMGVFKKIWADAWSARMQYILNNTLLALLEYPSTTLLGIQRMLNNADYRKEVVANLKDPVVKSFWIDEFARYSQRFETEATAAIQNKVGQFISNPLIRNILGQSHSTIDLRKAMDDGKILIANLSKGKIGEDNSALLGAMLITKLQLAAMSRVSTPEEKRRDFFLYVDEFQNFATESFANILSEARKYRLSLVLANQYLDQIDEEGKYTVRSAIFGNVGTILIFRVGARDAEFLEKEFEPEYEINDLVNLPKYHIYLKLMIDGISSRPFAAKTLSPALPSKERYKDVIIENSRQRYAINKEKVEKKIAQEWLAGEAEVAERVSRRDERPMREVMKPRQNYPSFQERKPKREDRPEKPQREKRHFNESPPQIWKKEKEAPKERARPKIDVESLKASLEEALKEKE